MQIKKKIINIYYQLLITFIGGALIAPSNAMAFSKLKNGFETITTTYLIPLAQAVAGAGFIYYVTMSVIKPEENLKKSGNVIIISCLIGAGLDLITKVIQSFS